MECDEKECNPRKATGTVVTVFLCLQANADYLHSELSGVVGLQPVLPQAGLSMVVRVNFSLYPALRDDVQFVEKLLAEEGIKCAAGSKVKRWLAYGWL